MGVPIDHIEVEIEVDKDLSGRFSLSDQPPGSKSLRYNVLIESTASEEEIQNVVEEADRFSPVLDDFRRAVPVERNLKIRKTKRKDMEETEL